MANLQQYPKLVGKLQEYGGMFCMGGVMGVLTIVLAVGVSATFCFTVGGTTGVGGSPCHARLRTVSTVHTKAATVNRW